MWSAVRGAHHRSPRSYGRSDPHPPWKGSWVPKRANSDPNDPFDGSLGREHQTWGLPRMFGRRSPTGNRSPTNPRSPTGNRSPTNPRSPTGSRSPTNPRSPTSPRSPNGYFGRRRQSPTTSDEEVDFGVVRGNTDSVFRSATTIPLGSRTSPKETQTQWVLSSPKARREPRKAASLGAQSNHEEDSDSPQFGVTSSVRKGAQPKQLDAQTPSYQMGEPNPMAPDEGRQQLTEEPGQQG